MVPRVLPAPHAPYVCINLVMGIASLYLVVGLWRLWETARRFAIAYQCLYPLNMWTALILPSIRGWKLSPIPEVADPAVGIGLAIGQTVVAGLAIWFLIKRKSAFVKPPTATQTSTNL